MQLRPTNKSTASFFQSTQSLLTSSVEMPQEQSQVSSSSAQQVCTKPKVMAHAKKGLKHRDVSVSIVVHQIRSLLGNGEVSGALEVANSYRSRYPREICFYYYAAMCQRQLGRHKEALTLLKDCVSIHKHNSRIWIELAEQYLIMKKFGLAASALKSAYQANQYSPYVAMFNIKLSMRRGYFTKALKLIDVAFKIQRNYSSTIYDGHDLLYKKAYCYHQLKQFDKALEVIMTGIAYYPKSLHFRKYKIDLLTFLDRKSEAYEAVFAAKKLITQGTDPNMIAAFTKLESDLVQHFMNVSNSGLKNSRG